MMTRNRGIGLMVCALIFVALVGPGHTAEAIVRADAKGASTGPPII
jgi:hypothetical protein